MTAADEWADLARLAEAATPGPWEVDHIDPGVWGPERIVIGNYTAADGFDSPMWEDGTREDREFIAAANPATILTLIAENGHLRGEVQHIAEGLGKSAERRNTLRAERDELTARLAAVEALANQWDEKATVLSRQSESRAGLSDAELLAATSEFYAARSANLRAVLSAAPTDTTKETDRE